MGVPKPIEGYPSRTAAIRALRAQGMRAAEIADQLGIPTRHVAALATGVRIAVPLSVFAALAPHAAARGCSTSELARRLVKTAIDDDLVDAILDDAEVVKAAA